MTSALGTATNTEDDLTGALYHQVQSFYAHQMQLLDSGRVDSWAETFTEEGVFETDTTGAVEGRETIRRAAGAAQQALRAKGMRHRHWLGMVDVRVAGADQLEVRSYALVLAIAPGGPATVHVSTTCDDELVREDGRWRVRRRVVHRDDIEAGEG
ncbi:nuclear transport factor 2 family protein [Streptomyces celluloflavus]|uniref:nuclear transport factor 2 family protein n=1 Tax=Streptomyces celluloflavus TaxID=58344 RepID=UPI003667BA6A